MRITDAVPITRKKRSWSILRPQCSTWGVCATMGRLATLAATRSSRLTLCALERLYVHGARGPNFNPHKKLRYVPDFHQAKCPKRSIPEQPGGLAVRGSPGIAAISHLDTIRGVPGADSSRIRSRVVSFRLHAGLASQRRPFRNLRRDFRSRSADPGSPAAYR